VTIRALHVFPLFGADLTNGSERYSYGLSRALARLPVSVEVVTTRARQMELTSLFSMRWPSDYPCGLEVVDGLPVRRFPVTFGLPRLLGRLSSGLIWRRWQAEAAQAGPAPAAVPERAEALFRQASARPALYHWLALLGLGPWSWPLWRWLERALPDYDVVLVGFSPLALIWQVARLARRCGKPLVVLPLAHLDDLYHHLTPLYQSYCQADALLAMTSYSAAVFRQLLPDCHPVEVGAGIDPAEFSAPSICGERFRAKYGLGRGNLVLYVGRKERVKRYDLALAAVNEIAGADTWLVMVGEDVDKQPIAANNVRVLGKLPRSDVIDAYDACQVLVFPSESESFGLVLLEAWLRRKPVIGNSACSPVAAIIDDGVDGYACATSSEMAQRVRQLLADPGLCAALGEAGYRKVQARYTWEHVSQKVYDVYLQVTARAASKFAHGSSDRP